MRGMLCEKCCNATATRETNEGDRLPGPARKTVGLILCARCRADAKSGARSERLAKRDVNPDAARNHRLVGGSAR